jgi:hypothetical protein
VGASRVNQNSEQRMTVSSEPDPDTALLGKTIALISLGFVEAPMRLAPELRQTLVPYLGRVRLTLSCVAHYFDSPERRPRRAMPPHEREF